MISERRIKALLTDIQGTIKGLENGTACTHMIAQTHKDLLIANLREKEKLLKWILDEK